jgi:hypothetical protein
MDPIGRPKEIAVLVLVAVTMFVTGSYVGVDWASYFHPFQSRFPAVAGYARDVLCAAIVVLIGGNRVATRDWRLLLAAFGLTMVADWFLTLNDQALPGTVIFLGVHALLIVRHAQGLRASFARAERSRTVRLMIISALLCYGAAVALIIGVAPILRRSGQFTLDSIYLLFLATSLWMGWGTLIRRAYARLNAWFIAVGMTFFYLCDVTVGLSVAQGGTQTGRILSDLIAFSYTPALLLLALSGIAWGPRAAAIAVSATEVGSGAAARGVSGAGAEPRPLPSSGRAAAP